VTRVRCILFFFLTETYGTVYTFSFSMHSLSASRKLWIWIQNPITAWIKRVRWIQHTRWHGNISISRVFIECHLHRRLAASWHYGNERQQWFAEMYISQKLRVTPADSADCPTGEKLGYCPGADELAPPPMHFMHSKPGANVFPLLRKEKM